MAWSEPLICADSEIKRVQGLPNAFVLKGNQKQKGHLAGQAVPPPSAAEIMVKALQILM
jgi:site-specific DNA-cytosine methylase